MFSIFPYLGWVLGYERYCIFSRSLHPRLQENSKLLLNSSWVSQQQKQFLYNNALPSFLPSFLEMIVWLNNSDLAREPTGKDWKTIYSLWLQFQCQSWFLSEKRSLHVATCYCAISRCRFRRSKVCSFLFLNRCLEVKEVKLWISLILLKHLMTNKTKYLATYPIPKLLVSDLDCLMTILHRAQHLVSASSGPLKGFVMPVSLRAQWSSERSSKNSSSQSPVF